MKAHHLSLFFILLSLSSASKTTARKTSTVIQDSIVLRRILHQPLFPAGSAPAPGTEISSTPPTPPSPDSPVFPDPSQPFFPEVPSGGQTPDQNQQTAPPPPAVLSSNASTPIPTATQPAKPAKKVAIAISVGIVTFGMLSGLAFLLYRHRAKKHHGETQKLVGRNSSEQFQEDSRVPPSSFLYIGTVEPSRRSVTEVNGGANISPYHKLNSVKKSARYRPSPELQPLPPLAKPLTLQNSSSAVISSSSSSSDAESRGTAFYTPQGSVISNEESVYASVSRSVNGNLVTPARNEMNGNFNSVPRSKRTSPKTMILASSPEMKHIIPSIKQQQPPSPPAPPSPLSLSHQQPPGRVAEPRETQEFAIAKRPKFSSPPPPPNMALLRSISSNSSPQITKVPVPPAPPPPPSLPPKAAVVLSIQRTVRSLEANVSPNPAKLSKKQEPGTPSPKNNPGSRTGKSMEDVNCKGASSSEKTDGDDMDSTKPKLKPLHWDKVRATSERATVWDQLKSSSFQLNEDMMETLFGCNSTNSLPREPIRRSVLPPVDQENRVLDPKKSQNIAILLRALNVTRDEVSEALLDGKPESLGAELLETLVKMAPTKEEEIKLREYNGEISKLGSAERFLKTVLDIPFAFRRVEAMLYRANFDTEVKYLRKSFQTLEEASEELKNSRLFLKLLEAVLRTGNRMNVGTNRGDAKAIKLDTLLKLVDIKGTDGKTTLLHFVVQEIIRSEGAAGSNSTNGNPGNKTSSNVKDEDFRKQGLQVVAGLSRDLSNVKKAAGMDSDVLSSYVSKLETGLDKVRSVLQYEKPDMQGNFFNSMRVFQRDAEEEIAKIKEDERKALQVVKEVTEYFHGNAAKEGAHPFRIFMIVRDFLSILDHVCKEVGHMQDRTMVGSARSFRISSTASLPVLSRYNVRQDGSSDDESLSP